MKGERRRRSLSESAASSGEKHVQGNDRGEGSPSDSPRGQVVPPGLRRQCRYRPRPK